jgi:hypothetical protein
MMVYLVKIPVTTGTKKAAVVRITADKIYILNGCLRFYTQKELEPDKLVAAFAAGNWLYFIAESK